MQVKLNVPAIPEGGGGLQQPGPRMRTRRFSGTMLGQPRGQLPRSSSACSNISFVSKSVVEYFSIFRSAKIPRF